MKSLRFCLLALAMLLVAFTEQSNAGGLGLNLCVGVLGGCQNQQTSIPSYSQIQNNAVLILQNGLNEYNSTISIAQNIVMDGISRASALCSTQPEDAIKILNGAIQTGTDAFYTAGPLVLLSMGEAFGLLNEASRQGLREVSLPIQYIALELLEQLRTGTNVIRQGLDTRGIAAQQSLEAARAGIEAGYTAMFNQIRVSLQNAAKVISNSGSSQAQVLVENLNTEAALRDSEILSIISAVNNAADNAIKKGADPHKVNQLRAAFLSALYKFGEIAARVRDVFQLVMKLAESDPVAARKLYLENYEYVRNRFQEIWADLSLDLGAAGIRTSSNKKQVGNILVALERGNVDITMGESIAQRLTLLALEFHGDTRREFFNAATQNSRFGKLSFLQRLLDSAIFALNLVLNKA